MSLTRHPMRVAAGFGDSEGCLILDDGQLVAVLVRLSPLHDSMAGHWYLEAAFGPLDRPDRPVFRDLEAAEGWIAEGLAHRAARRQA
jgi:hypothetical protein